MVANVESTYRFLDFLFVFSPLSVLAASGVLHGTTGIPTALIVPKLAKFRGL